MGRHLVKRRNHISGKSEGWVVLSYPQRRESLTTLIKFRTSNNRYRSCSGRCHNAKGNSCTCICGAAYHGASRNGDLLTKVQEHQGELLKSLQKEGTVIAAVLPLIDLNESIGRP